MYDDFLYAPIGQDRNGMPLTVLSALARQNVDPWEEAAALSRLPGDNAMQQLSSMIAALPAETSAPADPTEVAGRLVALLPHPVAAASGSDHAPRGIPSVISSSTVQKLLFISMYIALLFFGQWIIASVLGTTHVADASSTPHSSSRLAQATPAPVEDQQP
jgi:hypothetical protein